MCKINTLVDPALIAKHNNIHTKSIQMQSHLGKAPDVEDAFKALANKHPEMKVYKKEALPPELHYSHNRRIQDLIIVVDEGTKLIHSLSTHNKNTSKYFSF